MTRIIRQVADYHVALLNGGKGQPIVFRGVFLQQGGGFHLLGTDEDDGAGEGAVVGNGKSFLHQFGALGFVGIETVGIGEDVGLFGIQARTASPFGKARRCPRGRTPG